VYPQVLLQEIRKLLHIRSVVLLSPFLKTPIVGLHAMFFLGQQKYFSELGQDFVLLVGVNGPFSVSPF